MKVSLLTFSMLGQKAFRAKSWYWCNLETVNGEGFIELKDRFIKIGLQKPAGLSGNMSLGAHWKGGVTYTPQICNLGSLNSLSRKGWGNTWESFACKDGFHQEGKMPWTEHPSKRVWWFL